MSSLREGSSVSAKSHDDNVVASKSPPLPEAEDRSKSSACMPDSEGIGRDTAAVPRLIMLELEGCGRRPGARAVLGMNAARPRDDRDGV